MEMEQCDTASKDKGPATSEHNENASRGDDSTANGFLYEPPVNSKGSEVNKLSEVVRNLHNVSYIYIYT